MNDVKVTLNTAGIGKILKSAEVQQLVTSEAEKRSDSNTHIKSFIGFDRANAFVYPNTKENPG